MPKANKRDAPDKREISAFTSTLRVDVNGAHGLHPVLLMIA
jgi:hypothetical protein